MPQGLHRCLGFDLAMETADEDDSELETIDMGEALKQLRSGL